MTGTSLRWFFGTWLVMIAGVMLLADPWLVLKIVGAAIAIPLLVVVGAFVWGMFQAQDTERDGR